MTTPNLHPNITCLEEQSTTRQDSGGHALNMTQPSQPILVPWPSWGLNLKSNFWVTDKVLPPILYQYYGDNGVQKSNVFAHLSQRPCFGALNQCRAHYSYVFSTFDQELDVAPKILVPQTGECQLSFLYEWTHFLRYYPTKSISLNQFWGFDPTQSCKTVCHFEGQKPM